MKLRARRRRQLAIMARHADKLRFRGWVEIHMPALIIFGSADSEPWPAADAIQRAALGVRVHGEGKTNG